MKEADKVQWLFDQMNTATHDGVLATVSLIIKLEVEDKHEYTKDVALMQRLRQCWKRNEARIVNENNQPTAPNLPKIAS